MHFNFISLHKLNRLTENCVNLQRNFQEHTNIMTKKLLLIPLAAAILNGCGSGNDNNNYVALKNDSIVRENVYLNSFIDHVAWSMDSLVASEGMLLKPASEGTPKTQKQQITDNLKTFEAIVNRQHERIAELEKSLDETNFAHAQSMKRIIKAMKKQLADKDTEIAALKEELNNKNFSIERLQSIVSSLNNNIAGLNEENKSQRETIAAQSDMMSQAYVLIGTKKELKDAGALSSSGLFSKAKLKSADFNASKFTKVDTRKYKSIKLNSNKVKVLTPSPAGSYKISDNGDGTSTLTITSSNDFWSISKYLVIQIK